MNANQSSHFVVEHGSVEFLLMTYSLADVLAWAAGGVVVRAPVSETDEVEPATVRPGGAR